MRVIGPDGKQIGILSREEALGKARKLGLDLVEIAPSTNPPVAKIIEFAKFRYEQDKKAKIEKRLEKKGQILKEIWFTPLIGEADYQVRISRVKEFINEREKVRIIIKPKKRRLPDSSLLYKMMGRVIEELKTIAHIEQEPKLLGKQLVALVAPEKRTKNEEDKIKD